jgi:protein-S-isoprenylcysteine O-methyltransferase Ste14
MIHAFYEHSITALWLAWLIYWCVAAIGAKRTRRHESAASLLSHVLPLAVGVGLLLSQHFVNGWLAARFLPRSLVCFWLGFGFVASGLAFSIAARTWLGGNWSSTVTLKQNHELIRSGPYRWARHPIYTGLLLALLGSVIAAGEWRGLLGLVLVTVGLVRKIGIEERFMTQQFGDAYARYRAKVPALIPLLRRRIG